MQKKVVVVGLGTQGVRIHIPALLASSRAKLTGVVSRDQKDVNACSQQFHVPGYTDLASCLDSLKPDFVILAVYHNQYLPLVKEAAKRKIHVFCEKPFGYDLAEAKKLTKIVNSSKIHAQIGVQRRFSPDFQIFAEYIKHMRDKYFFEVNFAVGFRSPHSGWRGIRQIAGGGSIIDFGYHAIDVLLWNFGLPSGIITEMSWKAKPDEKYDTEDTATFLLRYKQRGFYGNVILSRVLPIKEYYKVVGSKEFVEYVNGTIRMSTIDGKVLKEENPPKLTVVEITTKEIDYFSDVIDGKVKPISTPTDHLNHMALIKAAYHSEKEGKYIDPNSYL